MDKQARSISFSRGKGKLTHTDRTFISPNVDQSRTAQNIVLINQNLSEAYAKIFGEAQANFNVKQKRKDRRIDDYFCKLFGVAADDKTATEVLTNTNKQQSFYEWVVGVGGAYDTGLVDWVNDNGEQVKANPEAAQLAAVCLTEYINGNPEAGVSGYAERNPNFHVMKAIIHMDEKTPHLHIDAVPFADGYKKGMTRQQGIAKALEAMGYGTGETAIAKWQEAERAVFREICERHGFVIRDEEKSRGYTVLTRQYGEFKENELKLEQQQSELDVKKQEIAQALTVRESEERAAEQARRQRETDEQASAEAQKKQQQAEATLHELQTAISDKVFEKANAFRVIGEKLSGGAKKLTSEEINTVQNMAAVIGQVMAEYKRATAEQDQSKKAYESAQKKLKDTLATEQDRIQYEAKNLSLNDIMRSKRELAEARKKAENDIAKATSVADKARKERDEARRVCEWATSEPFAETDRRYKQNRLKEQGRSLCD